MLASRPRPWTGSHLIWARRALRPVAFVLIGLLLFNTAASGASGLTVPAASDRRAAAPAAPAGPVPAQRWGSATGQNHHDGSNDNRTVPTSLRSRYPQHRLKQQPAAGRNVARVVASPDRPVRGFDRATSRELPDSRSAFERTYQNVDGTQTTEFSSTPVNYRRSDGTWVPIDTGLVADDDGWRNAADSIRSHLASRADASELVRVELPGATPAVVSYQLSGAAPAAGRLAGSTVTYRDVLPDTDLVLEPLSGGVKETLVLRTPDAPRSYVFPLRLTGLTAAVAGDQVVLTDATGTRRAVFPAGYMTDSAAGDSRATSTGVTYSLVSVEGRAALRVTLDDAWLRDPARVYPVLADPTVALPVDSGSADSAMYVHGGSSTSGSSDLLVGTVNGVNSAAYVKFGGLVDRLRYHTIYGAQLQAVNYDADSCSPRQVTVHPVTQSWSSGGSYSFPGPAVGSAIASRSFAHGYVAFGASSSACPAAAELFNLGDTGAKLVQRWVNGEQANYGLSLRASTDALSGKRFAGSSTANPPKLYVTHSAYNASYSIPSPVPNPPVLQNQNGKVKVTVTNRSASAWAPADYYLAYRAYDAKTGAPVGQQRSANLTTTVARGAKVTLDATIKAMPPGSYFLDFTMVRTGGVVFTDQQVPPGRIALQVIDIAPVVQELYPPNGYQAPTLTPLLWSRALDIDAPPGSSLSYKFEVCERTAVGGTTGCFNSGYLTSTAWTVPAGSLSWSKTYLWRVFVKDATTEVPSPQSALLTSVPQPELTSRIAGAPTATQDREFDAQAGNLSTAAVDATVTTVGPELNVIRTYNSLDPRRAGAFGAGWNTRYDTRLVPDDDGSGNVVVTYPDGQAVRFGKNPDGTYAAPAGRTAQLTVDTVAWRLVDKSRTTYQFSLSGRLNKITDAAQRSVVLTYNTLDGKLAKAQVSNSQTNTAGRSLNFTWTGAHVTRVTTDPVDGLALSWSYTYTGDLLSQVCAPGAICTTYSYATGSHYRSGVLDSKPESYWRLGEAQGTGAASEIAVNLGKDAGTYVGVTGGAAGALAGTGDTAASFNGTSSRLDLPKGLLKKSRDAAVELWFKATTTGAGGPLLGYQDKALGSSPTAGGPVLYVGTDGRLRGQFGGSIAPLASTATVNDGKWHHAVLSAMGTTQTLYLDGKKAAEATGRTIEHSLLTFNQVGAAYAKTPTSWPGWGSASQRWFNGTVDEVALYAHPLGGAAVAAHYSNGLVAADQLTTVTLPSGKVAATIAYDTGLDRVSAYTDRNGGTWKVGVPTVYGGTDDLRRAVQVLDPANRPHLYEYDALTSQLLRSGTPLGIDTREEDLPLDPSPSPSPSPSVCTSPDPNDPAFCTTIPDSAGGPVFVRHPLDGMAIRTFQYDDNGNQTVVTGETGDSVTMTYDSRGNVTAKRTCRTGTQCQTSYTTYRATITDPFDPRNDLPIYTSDARSASATDTTYRTAYTYTSFGELASQSNPDGSVVTHSYSTGAEAAYGGGSVPAGLLLTTSDARGKVTRYAYHHNGDLARVTQPSGLIIAYAYDALGRTTAETEISDSHPNGLTTTYGYDAGSRPVSTTEPATTDAVSGTRHQQQTLTGYDADGNVVRVDVVDRLGGDVTRTSTWEYDEYNRPVRITDAEGNETSYSYDRFGNRTSMVDANGNRYDYAYTARNQVAEVRLRAYAGDGGPTTGDYLVLHSYSYDFAGRMASDTDSMGRRLEYEYYGDDLLRRLVLKNFHNPDGTTRDYVLEENTYDPDGNLVQQIAGDGSLTTTQTYTKVGNVASTVVDPGGLASTTTFSYDAAGNVTRTTRSGKASNVPWAMPTTPEQVDYAYDDSGNAVRETVTAGTTTRVTTFEFDQRGLMRSTTDPRGNATGANPSAHTTTYTYDELGRQVRATGPAVAAERDGAAPGTVDPTVTTGYNTFDEKVAEADELGNVSRWTYDRAGRMVTYTAPSYWAPGGVAPYTSTTRTRYDGLGNPVEVTDPKGNATRYSYDQLGRLVALDKPGRTNDDRAVSRYTYTRTGELLSSTDPTGSRKEATYDDLDRRVTVTEVERKPTPRNLTTTYTYDDAGNITRVLSPTGAATVNVYDTVGQMTRTTDPNGVAVLFGYDHAGRQVRVSDSLGRTQQTAFDLLGQVVSESDLKSDGTVLRSQRYAYDDGGNMTASIDPAGVTTTYQYDAANRLVSQTEPVTATSSISTSFGYDAAGNRTRYTDGRGNRTIYRFNSWGLSESVIEPSTTAHPGDADRTWTIAYDVAGRPEKLTAPGGVVRQETYDAAGRVTRETGSGAGTPERVLDYDPVGRLAAVNAPDGTNTYTYNDRGQLLGTAGPSGTATFDYDGDGNVTSRVDAAGTATYTYRGSRLATAKDGVTSTTQQFGYDGAGQLTTVDYGSGRIRAFGYDDLGRVASDTMRNAAGQTVSSIAYRHDDNDRLLGKTTTGLAGAGDNSYGYDLAGRLVSWASAAGTVGYAWDDSGNRVRAGTKTATYDARNRLIADSDHQYTYTARGTLASRTSSGLAEAFDFDAFDRLVAAAGQAYTYDGLDRVATRNGVRFGYAGVGDEVVTDGTERYGRGSADELLAVSRGAQRRMVVADEHGDVVGGFDAADTTLAGLSDSTAYDPFGAVTAAVGDTGNLGYQADWTDPATAQVDMGARWYEPGAGAFISRDTVTYGAGSAILANRYTYAAGDPLRFTDPDGHWPSCGWCKKALKKVGSAISSGAKAAWSGIRTAGSYVWSGLSWAGSQAWSAIKWAGKQIASGAKWVYNQGKKAVNWVGAKISSARTWIANKAAAARDWARQKAEQARAAIYEAKKRVTQAARQAIAYAAKHNPVKAVAAALKPALTTLRKVVSAAASLPAAVVSTVRDVVNDQIKAAAVIYHAAVEAAGTIVQGVSTAVAAVNDFAQAAAPYIKSALKVAADVTGVSDLVKCVTKGALDACAWAAATIAGYLAGGVGGGAVRAARLSSLAARHADEGADLARSVNTSGNARNTASGASCATGSGKYGNMCARHDLDMEQVACNGASPRCRGNGSGNQEAVDPSDQGKELESQREQNEASQRAVAGSKKALDKAVDAGDHLQGGTSVAEAIVIGALGVAALGKQLRAKLRSWRNR